MKETNFQWEMHAAFTHYYPGAHYYKYPDPTKQESHRPYDAELYMNKIYWGLEYKMMKTIEAFPFDHIKDHQVFWLRRIKKNGGFAYFIINYRAGVTEKQREQHRLNMKKINIAWVVPVKVIIDKMTKGARSIPFDDFWTERWAFALNRQTIEKGLTLWSVPDLIDRDILSLGGGMEKVSDIINREFDRLRMLLTKTPNGMAGDMAAKEEGQHIRILIGTQWLAFSRPCVMKMVEELRAINTPGDFEGVYKIICERDDEKGKA